jgi:hypothetical protein
MQRVIWRKLMNYTIRLNNKLTFVRFEVFTAATMKNAIFWDVAPCRSSVNRRFRGTYRLHLQGRKVREEEPACTGGYRLQPPAHAGSSLTDLSTLKMEAIRSSETAVYTRSTRRHIQEDGILQQINQLN